MGLGKGVVVFVDIVVLLGSFGLGSGEFVGLMISRLYLGLFTETGGFGKLKPVNQKLCIHNYGKSYDLP